LARGKEAAQHGRGNHAATRRDGYGRHRYQVAEVCGGTRRERRAPFRGLHGQGRLRGAIACLWHHRRDSSPGRGDGGRGGSRGGHRRRCQRASGCPQLGGPGNPRRDFFPAPFWSAISGSCELCSSSGQLRASGGLPGPFCPRASGGLPGPGSTRAGARIHAIGSARAGARIRPGASAGRRAHAHLRGISSSERLSSGRISTKCRRGNSSISGCSGLRWPRLGWPWRVPRRYLAFSRSSQAGQGIRTRSFPDTW